MREQRATELFCNATVLAVSETIVYLPGEYRLLTSQVKHLAKNTSFYVLQLLMTAALCCSAARTWYSHSSSFKQHKHQISSSNSD
jgi:hypothetical protein